MKLCKMQGKSKEEFNGSLGLVAGGDYHVSTKVDKERTLQKYVFLLLSAMGNNPKKSENDSRNLTS